MAISYKKLWKLLIDKDMKKKDLQAAAGISSASVTKLAKNENVNKRLPGQLLILSTNEEINAKHMQTMSDSISNSFMLEFGEDKRTRVVENRYFEV